MESNLLSLSYGRIVRKDIEANAGLLPESFETYQIIEPDDIVFRLTDLQNDKRSLRTAISPERGIITSAYLAVTVKGAHPKFLAYYLRNADSRKVFYSMGGGLRQGMNWNDMKRLPVLVPPLEEQQAISSFLDRETAEIDTFIEDQEQLIELLTERRAATISHAVTKGLNPASPMKDSGVEWIDRVPATWIVQPVRRLAPHVESGTSVNGYQQAAEGDEVGVLKTGSASKGYFDASENKRIVEEDISRATTPVRSGTLLVNRANSPELVGAAAFVAEVSGELFLSDKLWQIDFRHADSQFVHYWTQSDIYRSQIRTLSVGASSSMQNLSYADFLSLSIAVPSSYAEQRAVINFLNDEVGLIDAAIADARESIALSRERRSALISAAVTGKIDVRGKGT